MSLYDVKLQPVARRRRFPFEKAAEAHGEMESHRHFGKLVLVRRPNRALKNYFLVFCRHSRENGNPVFSRAFWMPAVAGMTIFGHKRDFFSAPLVPPLPGG
ncbi:MAG: zinc-binding dehydrogenase [Nitrospinae bacterium]|nr:zinc-binding dehydrogenase [Nitrospinota bacterium]